MENKIKELKILQSPVLCKKDLKEKYHDILKKGGLTIEQLNAASTKNIIFQSSSGVTGEPFLLPRTKQDIEDIVHRCFFNFYQKEYGKTPSRIALFGGVSHTQAALKL